MVFDAEPMPQIDYLFAKLGEKKVLSRIDLSKGYWQIPVREEDRHKTAFSTLQGHFQWKVMPFGLCTSGAVFSRMMRKLLLPLQSDDTDNFIDDILISTRTQEEHLEVLWSVFSRLRECSLSARPSKCELGCSELEYLGHRVGNGLIKPEGSKMQKILDAPRPETKKQVRSFLGLVGYYRKFVPRFSEIAAPLTELTKEGSSRRMVWTERFEEAFNSLKEKFCTTLVCALPREQGKFVLRTDASDIGLGAILMQEQDGDLHPLECASRKLLPADPTIEKECLALVWAVDHFQRYLYGVNFVVQTDHSPLQHLEKLKSTSGRVTRWALLLQPYQFQIQAIPGKDNVAADLLSRL